MKYSASVLIVTIMAFAVYGWMDTAVSLDHARQQQKTERDHNELLRELVFASQRNAKRTEIAQFLKENVGEEHQIKNEQDRILVDDVVFRFDDKGSLKQVQFMSRANE